VQLVTVLYRLEPRQWLLVCHRMPI